MSLTVRAPAKINLHLGVGSPREDGFHPLLRIGHRLPQGFGGQRVKRPAKVSPRQDPPDRWRQDHDVKRNRFAIGLPQSLDHQRLFIPRHPERRGVLFHQPGPALRNDHSGRSDAMCSRVLFESEQAMSLPLELWHGDEGSDTSTPL
jgi:hypothetical protein